MTAKVTKIIKRQSYRGGDMYYVFFKNLDGDGKSYRTCLSSEFGNFPRWQGIISQFNGGKEIILEGLLLKNKDLIDADSPVRIAETLNIIQPQTFVEKG